MSKAKIQRRTIPFINPLRCIHALTISPGIVRAARPIEHVGRVRSNGVGHQALFKTGENWIRIEVLIWKCLVLFLKAFVCIFFSCPPPSVLVDSLGVTCGQFIEPDLYFCPMWMHAGACIKSCQLQNTYMRRHESRISDRVQPIKYNSWLLQYL